MGKIKQLQVKDLYEICKMEIERGNGNKYLILSNDNEGNGFHGMFYGLTPATKINGAITDTQYNKKEELMCVG